jgi:hypothetical protein
MQKKKNNVPEEVLAVFHDIIQKHGEDEYSELYERFDSAVHSHLTEEQRFMLYEQDGGCKGTGHNNRRKAFAAENICKPLPERLDMYKIDMGMLDFGEDKKHITINDDNTISVTVTCRSCYRWAQEKYKVAVSHKSYYGRCAGGCMYKLQQALGIKLRIKSIDVPQNGVDKDNPAVFTYEIMQ